MRRFVEPFSVYVHIKIMICKRCLQFLNKCISNKENKYVYLKSGFLKPQQGVVEATRIADLGKLK